MQQKNGLSKGDRVVLVDTVLALRGNGFRSLQDSALFRVLDVRNPSAKDYEAILSIYPDQLHNARPIQVCEVSVGKGRTQILPCDEVLTYGEAEKLLQDQVTPMAWQSPVCLEYI